MIQTIKYRDREHWLQLRTEDVTSTEMSALFGLNPYMTLQELWHQKRTKMIVRLKPNKAMDWGIKYEPVVAYDASRRNKWDILPHKFYQRDPFRKIGSSFDYWETKAQVPLEIKCTYRFAFRAKWQGWGPTALAPAHIEIQLQTQMAVSEKEAVRVAVGVGDDPEFERPPVDRFEFLRRRNRVIQDAITEKCWLFQESLTAGIPPGGDSIGPGVDLSAFCILPRKKAIKKAGADLLFGIRGWL